MKDLKLNKNEEEKLKERGFLVKKADFFDRFATLLVITVLSIEVWCGINYGLYYFMSKFFYTEIVLWVIFTVNAYLLSSIKIIRPVQALFLGEYYFFGKMWVINCNKVFPDISSLKKSKFYKYTELFDASEGKPRRWRMSPIIMFLVFIVLPAYFILFAVYEDLLSPFFYLFIGISSVIGLIFCIKHIILHFYPLYVFGSLWEKIQILTPHIEKRSKSIQKSFESDMDFSLLSRNFNALSDVFSEIIALIIRLEQAEWKANKWDIFDSEKYIHSLRADIVKPLKSLKSFLKNQEEQLLNSQKEIQKIRIWGLNEWASQSVLSSKKGELLGKYLTENISKLDMMIGKIEKNK